MDGRDVLLSLRVQPRARRDGGVPALRGGTLVVPLAAPPVDGKANAALEVIVAGWFGCPKSRVSVERGHRTRNKLVRIRDAGTAVPRPLADLGLRLEAPDAR